MSSKLATRSQLHRPSTSHEELQVVNKRMALPSPIEDDQKSAQIISDDKFANAPEVDGAAANAPEFDHAANAPEYRGSNVPPEVIEYYNESKYHAEQECR